MKLKELFKGLTKEDLEKELLVSSDEELNCLFKKWEVAKLTDRKDTFVIYGLSGSDEE